MANMHLVSVAAAGMSIVFAATLPANSELVGLAAHRATYDLMLDRTRQTPELVAMSGRVVMEFNGSRCGGYSVTMRFVTEIADPEGDLRVTDARTETFEAGDGDSFKFTNKTFIDETLFEESRGRANRTMDGVTVALTKPKQKEFVLDKSVVFPTEQIVKIIEAAKRDENFLQIDVYDGSEDGETVYATTVIIGSGSTSLDVGEEVAAKNAGVAGMRHWPVTVSYFDELGEGEQTPIYVMSFILYENGISRRLKIDYGDFAILGRLTDLQMLTPAECP